MKTNEFAKRNTITATIILGTIGAWTGAEPSLGRIIIMVGLCILWIYLASRKDSK